MSTDLTALPPDSIYHPAPTSMMIRQTAQDLADAHRIATALVNTSFVPTHFRGKPEEAAAAILYGAAIGMDPLTALQNVHVIAGRPGLYARAMVALVMSHGHRVWTEEEAEGSCTVAGRRKGSEKTERVTWTTEDARRAGYTTNKKYQTDPRSMLYARASGDVARRIAPDALLGMAYNVEELGLEGPFPDPPRASNGSPAAPPDPPAPGRVTAADFTDPPTAAPAAATGERTETSSHGEDEPATADPSEEPAAVSDHARARGRMFALFTEQGITDATQQREGMSAVLDRTITSRAELTTKDMRRVIAALEARQVALEANQYQAVPWTEEDLNVEYEDPPSDGPE